MIRKIVYALLATFSLGVLPSASAETPARTSGGGVETARREFPGNIEKWAQEPAYTKFLRSLDAFVQDTYRKQETVLDSAEGQAYLRQQLESGSSPRTESASTASLPAPQSRGGDPLAEWENELAGSYSDPTTGGSLTRSREASPTVSSEAFRASVTSLKEVKAFIVSRLYSDAEKLGGKASGGAVARGLDPLFLFRAIGPKADRYKSPLLTNLSTFFTGEAMQPQLGAFVAACTVQGEEPKRALAMLDAYVTFRKASKTEAAKQAAVTAGLGKASFLGEGYAAQQFQYRDRDEKDSLYTAYLWLNQQAQLERLSTAKKAEAAASVYAWLADAIVVMDVLNRPREQRQSATTDISSMPPEEFSRRLDALDTYVGKIRERQRQLAQALLELGKLTDPQARRAKAMQIKELYAGTKSRPLPLMIADIDDSPNVGRLASGLPAGTDEATRARHARLFNQETGTVKVLHLTEDVLEQRMIRAGFRDLVLNTKDAVESQRQERAQGDPSGRGRRRSGPGAAGDDEEEMLAGDPEGRPTGRRRKAQGGEESGGDERGGGAGRGTMDFLRGVGGAAAPMTEAILQANAQRDAQAEEERRFQQEQERQNFLRTKADEQRQEQLLGAETNASIVDRNGNTVEGAQAAVDAQREKERQEAIAFEQRQVQLREEARLADEQRRKAAAAAAAPAAPNPAATAGAGPRATAGNGPAAPANSTALPGSSATAVLAPGGGATSATTILSDAQIVEVARTKIALTPNRFGIEPAVLSDDEIKAALDPQISDRVAKFNQELAAKRMTVNADLQYSGPGIQTTGLPANHDRYTMWLGRFPEMGGAVSQIAQARYNEQLQQQVNALSAARQGQIQKQQATPSPVAVAQTAPAAPVVAPPVVAAPLTVTAAARREVAAESPETIAAKRVIQEFDAKAGSPSGIQPKAFLDGIARFNATNPRRLDISLPSLVQLVRVGLVQSRVPAPVLPEDLGPDGLQAQRVIDEFDSRAGGKSGISPSDFLRARDKVNATNPVKIDLNLTGLIRLINQRQLISKVPVPVNAAATPAVATPQGPLAPDDGRFDPTTSFGR